MTTPVEEPGPGDERPFELMVEKPVPGLIRRFLTIQRHFLGLALGALISSSRAKPKPGGLRRVGFVLRWTAAQFAKPFVRKELRREPFPVQLRRRLELLGPTYIKLGQVLSLRQDLLPKSVTEELKNLLDRLPVVPYARFMELVQEDLPCRIGEAFFTIDETPLGSASIAQIHRAQTLDGDQVILKVVKPGIRETLARDAKLLGALGFVLEIFLSKFRPRKVIQEFVDYTSREVDLRREADNAETFSANFRDMPDVVFPKIYPQFSGENVLCMEFLDGIKPDSPEALALPTVTKDRIVELGASSVIRMLYQDGFFHADLHPANLIILPGPKAGFIDLGMVGRFDEALRRTLLYYYYCLVAGDAENAARYLTAVAEVGPRSDPKGFQRALREKSERWRHRSDFNEFSLAQLILESVNLGGRYRIFFPVEMVLMVKALVTFEGVGNILLPGVNVAEVSKGQINRIFLSQFSPLRVARDGLRNAPELIDAVAKAPMLITEGLRALEKISREPQDNPFAGLRGTLFGGFCMVAGAILAAAQGPWPVWAALFILGIGVQLRRRH
ncbi:MAG: AarF/ABC1/UbiB kinase family protein [Deltaproteobacteria bacterium]|nr:AarF/ABC1/UbiB kinase family protein [Deltaproteobacteria bacterium]